MSRSWTEDMDVEEGSATGSGDTPSRSREEIRNTHVSTVILAENLDRVSSKGSSGHEEDDDEQGTAQKSKQKTERLYYLDWLRITSIYLVVSYHTIQCLRWMGLFSPTNEMVINYMATSLQFGMPVFFHISGRAQALARPVRLRTMLLQRSVKLLVPFVVCYFLLVPLVDYIGCESVSRFETAPTSNYFLYYIWYFTPANYQFNLAWLWFLPTLFGLSVWSGPILMFAETQRFRYLVLTAFVIIASVAMVCAIGFSRGFCVWMTMPQLSAVVLVKLAPFPHRQGPGGGEKNTAPLGASPETRWITARVFTAICILSSVGLVINFSYNDFDEMFKMVPAVVLFIIFYQQGYLVQRWEVGTDITPNPNGDGHNFSHRFEAFAQFSQIVLSGLMFYVISASSPIGQWEVESYPIYSASFKNDASFAGFHVAGTWAYIALAVHMFRAYANHVVDLDLYKHAASSTIVVYIFHWVFLKLIAFWVFKPLGMTNRWYWQVIDPLVLFTCGAAGAIGIYASIFKFCPKAGVIFGMSS